jgi:simple sugar transport system permease protein
MDWGLILNWGFLIALATAAISLAVPVLLAALGEIVTERAGVLNLGLDGVMVAGGVAGFMAAFYLQSGPLAALSQWLGLAAGVLAGMAMGLILAVLTITLRADQVVAGVTLVVLGHGVGNYVYRQSVGTLTARTNGLPPLALPGLSRIPVVGEIFFNKDATVYITALLVFLVWFLLFRTTWGLKMRAVGENPAAGDAARRTENI